jgi:hypothetical protein
VDLGRQSAISGVSRGAADMVLASSALPGQSSRPSCIRCNTGFDGLEYIAPGGRRPGVVLAVSARVFPSWARVCVAGMADVPGSAGWEMTAGVA